MLTGPERHTRVRVLGCGNPLRGDDGVGIAAVRSLRRELSTPTTILQGRVLLGAPSTSSARVLPDQPHTEVNRRAGARRSQERRSGAAQEATTSLSHRLDRYENGFGEVSTGIAGVPPASPGYAGGTPAIPGSPLSSSVVPQRGMRNCGKYLNRWPNLLLDILEVGWPGIALLDAMERIEAALIVDAVVTGARPGTIHRLDGLKAAESLIAGRKPDHRPGPLTSHDAGVAATIALGLALFPERLPKAVVILGVELEGVHFGEGLSRRVAAAVPALVCALVDEIDAVSRG